MSEKPTYEELEQRILALEQAEAKHKKTERTSKNITELLSFFIKHSPIYTFLKKVSHKDSRVLYTSDNYVDMIGVPASQMVGKTMYELFPQEFAEKITRDDIAVINKGNNLILEEELNGRNYITYKFPLSQGGNKYLAGYTIDVTDQKRTEEDLAQIFAMSLDMICVADINTATFIKVNPAFTEVLGYSDEELLEKPFFDFIHPEDLDETIAVVEEQLQMGARVINFDNRYRCKDGSYRWLSWVSHPNTEKGVTYAVARDITLWKQNKEELERSKALLNATGRMAKVGGWQLDADTLEVTWTEETHRIHEVPLGRKPLLKEAINFFHPEDRGKLQQAIQHAFDHGEPYDMEVRFITARGKHLWTRTICHPEIVDGKTAKLTGTFQDITDRKKAELALKESEEHISSIFRSAPVGIGSVVNRVFIRVNRQLCEITGYDEAELIGQSARILYPSEEEFELVGREKYTQISDHGTGTVETHWVRKDGTIINVLLSSAIVDLHDQSKGVTFTALDITERMQAEAALRESEEKLRKITSSAQDAIVMMDNQGLVTFWNESAEKIFGYSGREVFGKELHTILAPSRFLEKYYASFSSFKETGRGPNLGKITELSAIKKDGTEFPIELSLSAVMIQGGLHAIGIIRDITERRQAEAARKEMDKRLQQSQKMEAIGTLAGGIAHDFNNILSAVIGYTELLQMNLPSNSTELEYARQICKAGNRAKDLVQQILTFSRQVEQALKPVDVSIIIKEVIKLLRSSLPTTIEIRQKVRGSSLVMGDPTQIHQILMNLCTNAGHAMQENGGLLAIELISIELKEDLVSDQVKLKSGPYVQLSVSDTGSGMPAEHLDRVFEPFFTTKKRGEGTGLGLSVVHGIVESYQGAISLYSEEGKGTTFKIFLPLIERRTEPNKRDIDEIPKGTENILFVDDESTLVQMGKSQLEALGYQVSARSNSIEALALFKNKPNHFDLIITDMTMPEMTGEQLAIEIRRIRPEIPIILCTGFSTRITPETATNFNIDALLMKPIILREMAKIVRNVLD